MIKMSTREPRLYGIVMLAGQISLSEEFLSYPHFVQKGRSLYIQRQIDPRETGTPLSCKIL